MTPSPEVDVLLEKLGNGPEPDISDVERLLNEFEAHEADESKCLADYKEVAARTGNPTVKMLLQTIIADEERHHAITHAMAATLRGDLNWTDRDGVLRGLYELSAEDRKALVKTTDNFVRIEKSGIEENKRLLKASKGYYRDLFVLLLRSMIRDSEKHVEVLEFLRDRLRDK